MLRGSFFAAKNMKELHLLELEYIGKPDRKLYPYGDYDPEHRASRHLFNRHLAQHPSHPNSTIAVDDYEGMLKTAKVHPTDIPARVRAFAKRLEEQRRTRQPLPVEVELFIDRGK